MDAEQITTLRTRAEAARKWAEGFAWYESVDFDRDPGDFIEACSPEAVLDLLGELVKLRSIVTDLANEGPPTPDYAYQCGLCLRGRPSDGKLWVHTPECPWRRAVVLGNETP